jgi:hypothetical protein
LNCRQRIQCEASFTSTFGFGVAMVRRPKAGLRVSVEGDIVIALEVSRDGEEEAMPAGAGGCASETAGVELEFSSAGVVSGER